MRKSKFSESQIAEILREAEAGLKSLPPRVAGSSKRRRHGQVPPCVQRG